MNIEPKMNYFSIWKATFVLLGRHAGLLLWATLLLVTPFFLISAAANAHHMMTLGSAQMTETFIPPEQMRLLWAYLVGGDTLAFTALTIAALLVFKYLNGASQDDFSKHVRRELPVLLRSGWFWLFFVLEIVFFGMIESPEGPIKMIGMALFACSVLLLLGSQDRDAPAYGKRLKQLSVIGWISLVAVALTFVVLYIILNGFLNYFVLMASDFGAMHLVSYFAPGSPVLPYGAIILSRFVSQWFNLLPMVLLLATYLALRRAK